MNVPSPAPCHVNVAGVLSSDISVRLIPDPTGRTTAQTSLCIPSGCPWDYRVPMQESFLLVWDERESSLGFLGNPLGIMPGLGTSATPHDLAITIAADVTALSNARHGILPSSTFAVARLR
jgi:hypothetical protein